MPTLRVLSIVAGLGGLCLSQSLRRAGIDAQVYERDASPWVRPQAYRLHLEADGLHALHEILSAALLAVFDATAMRTNPLTTILKPDLVVLKQLPTSGGQDPEHFPALQTADAIHKNVDHRMGQSPLPG